MTSTLTLYYKSLINKDKNFILDKPNGQSAIETYLATLESQVISDFQYVKHGLSVLIRINKNQDELMMGNNARDLNYIKTVVEQVKADYNVDASRLYFTGQSQGSVLSHFVGMNLPEIFAAIGSTSAGINAGMIRLSVGLENVDDIIADIAQAFDAGK